MPVLVVGCTNSQNELSSVTVQLRTKRFFLLPVVQFHLHTDKGIQNEVSLISDLQFIH